MALYYDLMLLLLPEINGRPVRYLSFGGVGQCMITLQTGEEIIVPGQRAWTREEIGIAISIARPSNYPPRPQRPPPGPPPAWVHE